MKENMYISIPQLAKILGITRQAVYKKVKEGKIKAIKIGRNFAISAKYIRKITGEIKGKFLNDEEKKKIDTVVDRTITEYGEVLKMLGDE